MNDQLLAVRVVLSNIGEEAYTLKVQSFLRSATIYPPKDNETIIKFHLQFIRS